MKFNKIEIKTIDFLSMAIITIAGAWLCMEKYFIAGIAICVIGILGIIINNLWRNKKSTKPEESEKHKVLSARMTNCGEKIEDGKRCFMWQLVAKLHINTTERLTILFDKCFVELQHEQYEDIHNNFKEVMLVKKEYANNEACVYDKFKELQKCQNSQIAIDTPLTVTLFAMGETPAWIPGDRESMTLLLNLPVSERNYKSIQIKISVSKIFRNDGEIEFKYDIP